MARYAISTVRALFEVLAVEGHVGDRIYGEVLRRVDQIVAALEALSSASPDQWTSLEIPPLEEEPPPDQVPSLTPLKRLVVEVRDILRSLMPPAQQPHDGAPPSRPGTTRRRRR